MLIFYGLRFAIHDLRFADSRTLKNVNRISKKLFGDINKYCIFAALFKMNRCGGKVEA